MKRTLPIANVIALLATVAVNYLSVTGVFNGNTMSLQSARYPTLFTPAPWAFSIWGLIYLALGVFVVYQARNNEEARELRDRVGWWFVASCVANSCWVIVWMYDLAGLSVLVMVILLFTLIKIILRTDMELTDPPLRTIATVWWPFCLYSGWITVAVIANVSAVFVKWGWNGLGLEPETWAVVMAIVAGVIYLLMTWTRNMREYASVGAFGLIAVGVADQQRAPSAAITAFVVAGILVVSSGIHGYRNRAYSPFRKR